MKSTLNKVINYHTSIQVFFSTHYTLIKFSTKIIHSASLYCQIVESSKLSVRLRIMMKNDVLHFNNMRDEKNKRNL